MTEMQNYIQKMVQEMDKLLSGYEKLNKMCENKKIAYIAGPITGYENYRLYFRLAEIELKREGYIVLNPAILPEGLEHEQYMSITSEMLKCATAIFLLSGWTKSIGARAEAIQARDQVIDIYSYESWYNDICQKRLKENGCSDDL